LHPPPVKYPPFQIQYAFLARPVQFVAAFF
jgi:hypothetical protein